MICAHNMGYPKIAIKQLEILNSDKRIDFAKEFVKAKIINQKNYLRYLNNYYKKLSFEIEINKTSLKKLLSKIKKNIDKFDSVRFYSMHSDTIKKSIYLGVGSEPFDGEDVYYF